MTARRPLIVARTAAAAVGLVAALAVAGLPAYANDTATPTDSASPSDGASPSGGSTTPPASEPPSGGGPGSPTPPQPPGPGPSTAPAPPTSSPTGDPIEEPPPDKVPVDLAVAVPGSKVTVGSVGKSVRIDVDNTGYGTAHNVVLRIALGDLSDDIEVDLPGEEQDCQIDGEHSVCAYPDLAPDDTDSYVSFEVTPTPGAEPGPAGTVHVSVTSDNPDLNEDNNAADVALELIGSGPDLTAFAGTVGPLKPGGREKLQHLFYNDGDQRIAGFTATFQLPEYARLVETYSGCSYSSDRRRAPAPRTTSRSSRVRASTSPVRSPSRSPSGPRGRGCWVAAASP